MNSQLLKPLIWYVDGVWVCSCTNWLGKAPEELAEYSKWVSAGAGHTPVQAYTEWLDEVEGQYQWLKQSGRQIGDVQ